MSDRSYLKAAIPAELVTIFPLGKTFRAEIPFRKSLPGILFGLFLLILLVTVLLAHIYPLFSWI
jgi:hypothetical protein